MLQSKLGPESLSGFLSHPENSFECTPAAAHPHHTLNQWGHLAFNRLPPKMQPEDASFLCKHPASCILLYPQNTGQYGAFAQLILMRITEEKLSNMNR